VSDETRPIVAGRANEAAVGAPDSIAWKIHREIVLLAGWGRAILLQLAHPLVAQGVADHSGFATESGGHVRRLSRTLHAMLDLTFGQPHDAAQAAERINRIHDRVHGALAGRTGAFAAGTGYKRPMDMDFGPDGALYLVDFGAVRDFGQSDPRTRFVGPADGPLVQIPKTGVIWKIERVGNQKADDDD